MLDIVRQLRREDKASLVILNTATRMKRRGLWCRFRAKKIAAEEHRRSMERIAVARVHQRVDIERCNRMVFEEELTQLRRQLYHFKTGDGPKFEIIDMMLEILDGRRKVGDYCLHDMATSWLAREIHVEKGENEDLAKKIEDRLGQVELAFQHRKGKLKDKGREDEEEYEMLSIMLAMIKDERGKRFYDSGLGVESSGNVWMDKIYTF